MTTTPSSLAATGAKALAGAGLTTALLVWAMPRTLDATWSDIAATVRTVDGVALALLAALWLVGLAVHTTSLVAALPGLSHRRAFLLNITGSCVANLLPLGGAAGTVVNYSMARTWGFGPTAFARWALVTNVWDLLVKLTLPAVAVAWLASTADGGAGLHLVALAGLGAALLVVATVAAAVRDDRLVRLVARTAARVATRLPRDIDPSGWEERAGAMRRDTASLVAGAPGSG